MKEKIETFKTAPELDCQLEDYNYQDLLTPKLDALEGDFDQGIINEIVLWKVNRYAQIKPQTLALLNKIKKEDKVLDEKLTQEILLRLLGKEHKGIRLAAVRSSVALGFYRNAKAHRGKYPYSSSDIDWDSFQVIPAEAGGYTLTYEMIYRSKEKITDDYTVFDLKLITQWDDNFKLRSITEYRNK